MRARHFAYGIVLFCALANAASSEAQHDFDFELGTRKTHVSRLTKPLSGSRKWLEHDGTSVVRPLLQGHANLVELDVTGPSARGRAGLVRPAFAVSHGIGIKSESEDAFT